MEFINRESNAGAALSVLSLTRLIENTAILRNWNRMQVILINHVEGTGGRFPMCYSRTRVPFVSLASGSKYVFRYRLGCSEVWMSIDVVIELYLGVFKVNQKLIICDL